MRTTIGAMLWAAGTAAAIAAASAAGAVVAAAPVQVDPAKVRLLVLTDIGNEPDDSESLVRLLVYADAFDIEALVATTSDHQRARIQPDLIRERVRAYGQSLPNLRRHAAGYPDAALLLARIRNGAPLYGMANVGDGRLSDGARAIIAAGDRADARPLWITIWGGAADLAQALWTVRATRTPAEVAAFVARLRVYSISDQDDAGPWLRSAFPQLFWIASIHGFGQYPLATWSGISADLPGADPEPVSKAWLARNIRARGPLGALYPEWIYIMEGDTPSFRYLLPNGLGSPDHPDWGGWGGRYARLSPALGLWTDVLDSARGVDGAVVTSNQASVWRWRQAFQNDFAARMLWTTTPDRRAANHPPELVLNGIGGQGAVEIAACPGRPVTLSARGSRDPDGQPLALRWWWYREAGGMHPPALRLSRDGGETTQAVADAPTAPPRGTVRFHVILEGRDAGTPALTAYRRAVLVLPADPAACPA